MERGEARLRLKGNGLVLPRLALLMLPLSALAPEAGVRPAQVPEQLRGPSYHLRGRQFDIHWDRLGLFARPAGGAGCGSLGSAQTNRLLGPERFRKASKAETGHWTCPAPRSGFRGWIRSVQPLSPELRATTFTRRPSQTGWTSPASAPAPHQDSGQT
jgi:hypothetical protein